MAEKTNDVQRNWLQAYYKETVVPALIKEFNYTNINQVPKIEKIVLNMGLGDVRDNAKSLQLAVDELKLIAGQKPIVTKAERRRKSYASWTENVRFLCKTHLHRASSRT